MSENKILFFGDSVMKGIVYDGVPGKYHLCRDKLMIPGIDFQNRCRMGATIASGIQTIERFLPECDGSTLVVLEYGGNDCNYNWKAVSENPEGSHSCAVPPEEYVNLMKKAIGMLKSRGSSVMISTLAPIHSEPFLGFISQGLSKRGILRWLGKVERLGQWQAYYSELAQKVAQELDCPLLPLRKAAMAVDWEKFLCADGIHPTEEGHRVLNAFAVRELTSFCCI